MRTPMRKKQLVARLRSVKTTASSDVKKTRAFIKVKFARGEYVRTFLHKTVAPSILSFFFTLKTNYVGAP